MSGLSDEALKHLNNKIDEIREELKNQLNKIPKLKQNMHYDLFKFGVIGFVCIFFAIILVKNTMKSLNIYFRTKNYERLQQKSNLPVDENEYYSFENDINFRKELIRNIHKSSQEQNKLLENAKREKISARNETVNDEALKLENLDANIDINSIDKQNDNYAYGKNKSTSDSFWEMIFSKKDDKYHYM
tara:strand:+ start:1307 stop:1870 length:564 start_codon:yes stop_codon:yes gene_type:complete